MIRANASINDKTPRLMSHSQLARHTAAIAALEAQCKARGVSSIDLEDFEIGGGRVRRICAHP